MFQKQEKHLWGLVLSSRRSSINFATFYGHSAHDLIYAYLWLVPFYLSYANADFSPVSRGNVTDSCIAHTIQTIICRFFSRLAAARRRQGSGEVETEDVYADEEEQHRREVLENVTGQLGLQHPIYCDSYCFVSHLA